MEPVLWHLKVSNYNEKARWALDYKGVRHVRRAVEPGWHKQVARKLTDGRSATMPILVLDGDVLADSTEIVAALEGRWPEPPLYPSDPDERERALALEDFFDEELGPYIRLLVLHHLLPAPGLFLSTFVPDIHRARRPVARAIFPLIRRRIERDFGVHEASVRGAYAKIAEAGERLRDEVQPSGYLRGDGFSVADLTLAALAAPAVAPEQFPYPQPQRGHPLSAPLRAALADAGILDFTHEMYTRHRSASAEVPAYSVS